MLREEFLCSSSFPLLFLLVFCYSFAGSLSYGEYYNLTRACSSFILTLPKQLLLLPPLFGHFSPIMDCLLQRFAGQIYGVLKIDLFKVRSPPPHQPLAEMLSSTNFPSYPAAWRCFLWLLPSSTGPRVDHDHTCLHVDLTHGCVSPMRHAVLHQRPLSE